jgi:Protein of unknown function (DUF1579)
MNKRMMIAAGSFLAVLMGMPMSVFGGSDNTAAQAVDEAIEAVQDMSDQADAAGEIAEDASGEAMQDADAETPEAHAAQAQAMADWMKLATPGEYHAKLDAFVGNWDVTTEFWMAPGMPAQVNTGTSEVKWILGGRFIQEDFQSVMQMPGAEPQAFQGVGITGYDNAKGEYTGTWADTMSTTALSSTGQFDDSTQTLTLYSEFDCPMSGPSVMRMTLQVVGPDELVLQGFKTPQGQEEARYMQITYKRRY